MVRWYLVIATNTGASAIQLKTNLSNRYTMPIGKTVPLEHLMNDKNDTETGYLQGVHCFQTNDFSQAIDLLVPYATDENPRAMYLVGAAGLYSDALSLEHSVEWLVKASEHGIPEASRLLGMLYHPEVKMFSYAAASQEKDLERAKFYFNQGFEHSLQRALAGDVEAQTIYGCALLGLDLLGTYIDERNVTEGLRWLTVAAERNHPYAAWMLACEYLLGTRVPKDSNKAKQWCLAAIENGLPIHCLSPDMFDLIQD